MKIIKNEKLIERNGKIGNWISIGALAVLGGGMYLSFVKPELFIYSLACLALGFIMTQIGMFMTNRWGRSPRPDEKLDAGLKGLHSEFNMYHYTSPASHLLVGPSGLWIILPFHQGGKIYYEKNRWRIKGGGFIQSYMRIFGQEGIGRPDLEADADISNVKRALAKKMDEAQVPDVKAVLVFTNDQVELEPGDSPIPAMKLKQLKEFMRQGSKSRALSVDQINKINEALTN